MPNSLQYPLERHRDLQRRWERLLQRTTAPKERVPDTSRHLRAPARAASIGGKLGTDNTLSLGSKTPIFGERWKTPCLRVPL